MPHLRQFYSFSLELQKFLQQDLMGHLSLLLRMITGFHLHLLVTFVSHFLAHLVSFVMNNSRRKWTCASVVLMALGVPKDIHVECKHSWTFTCN